MSDASFDMSPDERAELIGEFLTESELHLTVLNEKLLQSEAAIKKQQQMSDQDLNAMFRAAHTIKGTASFIGLTKIVKLTHEMETILQRVQNHQMPLTAQIIDVLFGAFDVLGTLFTGLRENGEESGEIEESVDRIKAVLNPDAKSKPAQAPQTPVPQAVVQEQALATDSVQKPKGAIEQKYLKQFLIETEQYINDFNTRLLIIEKRQVRDTTDIVNEMFRMMHTMKGSSGIINAVELVDVAHNMESILSFYREKKTALDSGTIALMFKGIDTIKELWVMLRDKQTIEKDISGVVNELKSYCRELTQVQVLPQPVKPTQVLPSSDANVIDFASLVKLGDLLDEQKAEIAEEVAVGKNVYALTLRIESFVSVKSMKGMLIQERIKKLGGSIICVNPIDDIIDQEVAGDVGLGIIFCSSKDEDEITPVLFADGVKVNSFDKFEKSELVQHIKIKESDEQEENVEHKGAAVMVEPIEVNKVSPAPSATLVPAGAAAAKAATPMELSVIKIDSKKLDNLMNLSGELVILRAQFARLVGLFGEDISQQKVLITTIENTKLASEHLEKEFRGFSLSQENSHEPQFKKIQKLIDGLAVSVLDLEKKAAKVNLINRIHALDETTRSLGKISSDIQSGVMQTRMIPIEGVFTRFRRIVRDISKDLGKEVNLVIEGEETELDKKIVDSLSDPLTHMIRNAVDHGLEDKETRQKANKPEAGTISLRAFHKGNNMCIEIGDDGKGIDPEMLVASALKKGLVSSEQVSGMTEKDKFDLMFLPGLSTAQKVTGLSGRGVGMDVVKSMINSVNGVVDIETTIGQGTTFVMKIPLTLAIIQALLVYIGEETYAIPVDAVKEIVSVNPAEVYSIDGNQTVKIREHALSLVELEKIIHIKGAQRKSDAHKTMVIIRDGETQLGVVVDSLIGEDEIVIKSLTDHFSKVKGITGASILGDGRIALILDPVAIIKESK